MHSIRGDQHVALCVLYIRRGWKHVMNASAMLHPLEINHVRGEVRRRVALDGVVFVGDEIRPRRPTETSVLHSLRLDRGVIKGSAPAFKDSTDNVGKQQRRK